VALRRRLDALAGRRPPSAPRDRAYLVVEKILLRGETLPDDWECDGTSGYDFMNEVSAVQHDARGESRLGALWESLSRRSADFAPEEQAARREIIARSFSAQLEACTATFHRLARAEGAEMSRASLRRALVELLAHFPIYRTYATPGERPARDRPYVAQAIAAASTTALPTDRAAIDRLSAWLTETADPSVAAIQDRALTQFQQLSAPIAAKAVEDTAFYRYGRLLSRNDVGFDVTRFSDSASDFHAKVMRRGAAFPRAMLATATHDHKRGEDARARLAVLSEFADAWASRVPRWIAQCRPLRQQKNGALLPSDADVAMLLQTVVGTWPLTLDRDDDQGRSAFAERLVQWQEKALREAKLVTDWSMPNESYEAAARRLVMSLVTENAAPALLSDIAAFVEQIAPAGVVNGLAQTLLKLTAPGVPDIYQGTEFWDFSLVDPDNRRPIDFAARRSGLDAGPVEELTKTWRSGHLKQALIVRALAQRRARPRLFAEGSYEPLPVRGKLADRVIAFARRLGSDVAIAVVPRTPSGLLVQREIGFRSDAWQDTSVTLRGNQTFKNIFDEQGFSHAHISVGQLFERLPFALLMHSAVE
jgi:(1->4)-alpha-D-glucan 1-alpha-D-glucosylmutase